MTHQERSDPQFTNEEAAELVQNDPALGADPTREDDDNQGVDDDAKTPDQAVSNKE
jgi:hypothetical protein